MAYVTGQECNLHQKIMRGGLQLQHETKLLHQELKTETDVQFCLRKLPSRAIVSSLDLFCKREHVCSVVTRKKLQYTSYFQWKPFTRRTEDVQIFVAKCLPKNASWPTNHFGEVFLGVTSSTKHKHSTDLASREYCKLVHRSSITQVHLGRTWREI